MDGANNPQSSRQRSPPNWRAFHFDWESQETTQRSTNLSGTNLDSAPALAPEREARRGEPHGWGEQSPVVTPTKPA